MRRWPDSFALDGDKLAKWRYDQGVILKGIEGIWMATGDKKWFDYLQHSMDFYVSEEGAIRGYRPDEYNIDHVNNGRILLTLYQVTGKAKYLKAATALREQLKTHPRTSEGSFWHKKIYPNQVWLDGLYMGQPFYAEWSRLFGEDSVYSGIARQFALIEQHTRDSKSGLLYHAWDASRQEQWADKTTGRSPHVWGRAMGWYGMALVDVLDEFPEGHKGRDTLVGILNRFARAITAAQDPKTGLWYDVLDLPKEPKNYFEASAASMFVYTLAKGVRQGYLPATYLPVAKKAYAGILQKFVVTEGGQTHLNGTVAVSGLGGKPYRDGSFTYYMSEPVIQDDPKGMGAFILASNEIELAARPKPGQGKTIVLDRFFNNEYRKEGERQVRFHYTWEDRANSGFSLLGSMFRNAGFRTRVLDAAPTAANLKGAGVYLIVDPDTEKETAKPNFMTEAAANAIAGWVKGGGVLVLMANDKGNAELTQFNKLASKFGFTFNEDNYNLVEGSKFEQGAVLVEPGNPVFPTARKLYLKEVSTLNLGKNGQAVVTKEGKNIIARIPYGKGVVLAVGDPWLYNEYTDGRKLPSDFENYKAALDLVQWAAKNAKR
jgi:unsaturated rhamnogalacturonyl hydrolase